MTKNEIMGKLESLASHDPKDLAGMARFGINVDKAWVVSIPNLRELAKDIRKAVGDRARVHDLALQVYDTDVHEAKILAGFMDYPDLVLEPQMEKWVLGFDSWDLCDMVSTNLFDRTALAWKKSLNWSEREEEFVKRSGFVIMAGLAIHDKKARDANFYPFLDKIKKHSNDERNYVKKAISWALRQIGKSRNKNLYEKSLQVAEEMMDNGDKTARWIASDAIRELKKEYIKKRFIN